MIDETALQMRRKGAPYSEIAASLSITESEAIEVVAVTLEQHEREDERVRLRLQLENMEKVLGKMIEKAAAGDQAASERVLKLIVAMDATNKRLEVLRRAALVPTFPTPSQTPGQGRNRNSYADFIAQKQNNPWWETYLKLRERWDWRKAAFIAWSVMPSEKRLPPTQRALAVDVLGLKDDRAIRKWRENDPEIEQAIEAARLDMAGDALNDVLAAWAEVAAMREPAAQRDRITFLEWKGVYKGAGVRVGGMEGAPLSIIRSDFGDLSDADLDGVIANLLIASQTHNEET